MSSIYPKAGTISDRLATLSGHISLDSYTVAQDEKTAASTGSFPSLKAQGTSWDQLPQSIPTLRQLPCQEGWGFGWNFRKRKGKPWRGSAILTPFHPGRWLGMFSADSDGWKKEDLLPVVECQNILVSRYRFSSYLINIPPSHQRQHGKAWQIKISFRKIYKPGLYIALFRGHFSHIFFSSTHRKELAW